MEKLNIKESLAWNTGLRFLIQIVTFSFSIVLARILDPNDFGIMASGMVIINYANSITDFGFYNAIIQRENISQLQVNSVFTLNFFLSVMMTILAYFFAGSIAGMFHSRESERVLQVLSVIFLSTSFSGTMDGILKRNVKHKVNVKIDLISSISNYSIAIVFALLGWKYWALVLGNLVGHLMRVAGLFFVTRWRPRLRYDHEKMKEIYSYGFWNFLRAQMNYVNGHIMHVIIGTNMGTQLLGLFDKGYEISAKPMNSFGKSINSVMFASFSRMQNDKQRTRTWFMNLLFIQTIVIVPMYTYLMCLSDQIVIVLLGEKWSQIVQPLNILAIARIFQSYTSGFTALNIATSQHKKHTYRGFASSIVLLVACFFGVRYEITGVCLAYLGYAVFSFAAILHLSLAISEISIWNILRSEFPYLAGNILLFIILDRLKDLAVFQAFDLKNLLMLSIIWGILYMGWVMMINKARRKPLLFPLSEVYPGKRKKSS